MKKSLDTILSYTYKDDAGCFIWKRCFNTDGYPRAVIDGYNNAKVHRVVWELHNGKSAKGYVVRHKCDNPKCINPEHLEIGTPSDNMRDRGLRNRTYSKLTVEQVVAIKKLGLLGMTAWELQKIFPVCDSTIQAIFDGRTWKHVTI